MSTIKQSEMFLLLAIAQGLIRNRYAVTTDERLTSNLRADMLARKGEETIIVELKVVSSTAGVKAAVKSARNQLARIDGILGFVAVGVQGTQDIFLDKALDSRLRYTAEDFHAEILSPTP